MSERRRPPDLILIIFSIIGAILLIFIALPIIATVVSQDLSDIGAALQDTEVKDAIIISFGAALIATALSCVMGIPLAYVMARTNFPGKGVVQSIIDLPIVIPHTIAGITLLVVFGRMGIFSNQMDALNLRFEDHLIGIVIAMMFVSASFIVNSAREGFELVDERYEHVARSLGATRTEAFLTVTVPLSLSSIVTGAVMSWARAVSEFGAIVIIAYFPKIIPTLIYERNLHGGLSESLPIAALMILLCAGIFIVLRVLTMIWKNRISSEDEGA